MERITYRNIRTGRQVIVDAGSGADRMLRLSVAAGVVEVVEPDEPAEEAPQDAGEADE